MKTHRSLFQLVGTALPACAAAMFLTLPTSVAAAEVTLPSLLHEMVDRDAAASLPAPAFTLKQSSSHDPRKTDPANAEGWHSNNDHDNAIRTEVNEGRNEWVIMEDQGPGAIMRYWTPLAPERENQIIRFYFDGSPTPAITAKLNDLFRGCGFVPPPFAFVSFDETDLRHQLEKPRTDAKGVGGDLYLPIPYAKGCKITLDSVPFYYVINFRSYEAATSVKSFSMADFEAAKPLLRETGEKLLEEPAASADLTLATIGAGEAVLIQLPPGPAAVRELRVHIKPEDAPAALRSLIVQATFDGEATVWCPLSEFFGAGVRLQPVQDWWRSVGADGQLSARWVMPYAKTARLTIRNVADHALAVQLAATTGKWTWDERSLLFHANWRGQLEIGTQPRSDWNYLDIQGQGRYVGDTLTVFSPSKAWYGEGDERIYQDGAALPGHIGTGTEDYYGYAWGMADFFSSPFISMPRREIADRNNWLGYTTTSRVRPLDSIPFKSALKLDMEIWHWADCKVDYAVGTFWYARPGARHNREPQPSEAAAAVRELPGVRKIAGAIECEGLTVSATSPGLQVGEQAGAMLAGGSWSGDKQVFVQSTKVGDFIEFAIPVADDKPHQLTLYATRSYDYGLLRFTVNGMPAGKEVDFYHPEAMLAEPVDLGTHQAKDGKLLLRAEVTGANAASRGPRFYCGFDCIALH
ncbi:MAG: DUF2961 domain-containing protein [Verrucomicrobia bacterium]|nr:DUF2961 domain-containing protein [Verrucomicrobiota bacterium]